MTKNIGVYNYFGNGNQYYSWIHIDDLCNIFINQIENESTTGIYNAVSPKPLTNKKFTAEIKDALNGNLLIPAPAFGLRLMLGDMADVVLNSNRVYPKKLEKELFKFKYADLGMAVKDILSRNI